jgi:hypothetical protein
LVRAFFVVVFQVFLANVVHVLLAEDHEPIKAFLLDGLNEPLDKGIRVRGAVGVLQCLDADWWHFPERD